MSFLNPGLAIAGLAAVAIPIIIHLLMRRRRRPIQWAAMRFLLEAYRKHRRRLRLEQLLLLAARCAVVALIGLALGRPLLGALAGRTGGPMTLYVLVDNGLAASARAEVGGPTALDRHKAEAARLLSQLDPAAGDRAGLIALGGPAEPLVVPASHDIGAVRTLVEGLRPTDSAADLDGAVAALRTVLDAGRSADGASAPPPRGAVVAILSDFLAGSADTQRNLGALGAGEGIRLLASAPAEAAPGNVTVESVEPLRPVVIAGPDEGAAEPAPVRVRLRRSGAAVNEPAATTVRLSVERPTRGAEGSRAVAAGQAVVRWSPGQAAAVASVPAEIAPPERGGEVVLIATVDADAIAGDNTHRRPVEVRRSLRVGIIAPRRFGVRPTLQNFDAADWFRLALQPTPEASRAGEPAEVEAVQIEPTSVDAAQLAALDAAIVTRPDLVGQAAWGRLHAFAEGGGLVMVTPPAEATVHLWADQFTSAMGLGWSVAREATEHEPGAMLARQRPPQPGGADLLAMIAAELPDLGSPVRVFKALGVEVPSDASASTVVLALEDGAPVVLASPPGAAEAGAAAGPDRAEAEADEPPTRGLVVLWTVAPAFEWTDLPARPLMVPLTQELVRQGVGRARPAWSAIAGTRPDAPARSVELRPLGAEGPPTPVASDGRAAQPIRHATLLRAVDERGATRGLVAVNADPRAGRTTANAPEAVRAWLSAAAGGAPVRWIGGNLPAGERGGELQATLERGDDTPTFSLPLLIAALAVAVAELAMARWFSHASAAPESGAGPVVGTTGSVGGAA